MKVSEISGKQILVPPLLISRVTDVEQIEVGPGGWTRLNYCNGNSESRQLPIYNVDVENLDFQQLIDMVQGED